MRGRECRQQRGDSDCGDERGAQPGPVASSHKRELTTQSVTGANLFFGPWARSAAKRRLDATRDSVGGARPAEPRPGAAGADYRRRDGRHRNAPDGRRAAARLAPAAPAAASSSWRSRPGVSARHLSFLETGRSRPSREMVLRLAEQLEVPLRERNRLLLAAGYAPAFGERELDDARARAGARGDRPRSCAATSPTRRSSSTATGSWSPPTRAVGAAGRGRRAAAARAAGQRAAR